MEDTGSGTLNLRFFICKTEVLLFAWETVIPIPSVSGLRCWAGFVSGPKWYDFPNLPSLLYNIIEPCSFYLLRQLTGGLGLDFRRYNKVLLNWICMDMTHTSICYKSSYLVIVPCLASLTNSVYLFGLGMVLSIFLLFLSSHNAQDSISYILKACKYLITHHWWKQTACPFLWSHWKSLRSVCVCVCVCMHVHVPILMGLLFLEISVHLGTPTIILSLQTFSKDDQIALLEKSISSVIAYVPRARVLSFAANNSTGTAGSSTAYRFFILHRWSRITLYRQLHFT